MVDPVTFQAFADETQKIAAASGLMRVAKTRAGKRPLKVSTLLRKENEGSLWKKKAESSLGTIVSYADNDAPGTTGKPAKRQKTQQETPSREDGRDFAATVPGPGRTAYAPGVMSAETGNY